MREDDVIAQITQALQSIALPTEEMLNQLIRYLHTTHSNKKNFHRTETKGLKEEHGDIEERLDKLVELMIDGRITDEAYQKKNGKLKEQQRDITSKLTNYDAVDGKFAKQLDYIIKIAHGAADYFNGSELSQKRDLLKVIFQNLELRGKKLEYSMAFPFSEFEKCRDIEQWWRIAESNR